MKIKIQSLHFKAGRLLEEKIRQKIDKLDSFQRLTGTCDVILKAAKPGLVNRRSCEIRIYVPGRTLYASRSAPHFEAACGKAVTAIRKQFLKKRSRNNTSFSI